jgi:uncharacterized membrane protein
LFSGNADAARAVLSSVTTSMVTVTSLTFSLTVVTLQLASSQFSPRLLRTFSRDRFVHTTLGLFLATFAFGLTVLRTVHDAGGAGAGEVPKISVTVAFVLAIASVFTLVFFLAHLAREIRVETMLRRVHAEASHTIRQELRPLNEVGFAPTTAPALPPTGANLVLASHSGFVVSIDVEELLDACVRHDVVLAVERGAGSMVTAGTPIARWWRALADEQLSEQTKEDMRHRVTAAVKTDFERTSAEDVAFGLQQITDVAVKALSPGINDPTTARHALGHSAALLIELAARELGPRVLTDSDGEVRLVLQGPDLGELLDLAVGPPSRYGAGDPDVLVQILRLLREVGWSARLPEQREAVGAQLERVMRTAAAPSFDLASRHRLEQLASLVEDAVDDRWPTSLR